MASPQPDKYTRLSNELLEHVMKLGINGTEFRIVLAVWRFTYGFQRKSHILSIDFIAAATNIHHTNIKRSLKALISKNVIVVVSESLGPKPRKIAFNKDYETWLVGVNQLPVENESEIVTGSNFDTKRGTDLPPLLVADSPPKKEKRKSLKKEDLYMHNSQKVEIIFNHWNSLKLIKHRKLIPHIGHQVNFKIAEGFSLEEMLQSITSYSLILNDSNYKLDTKWSLNDFLEKRHFEKFLPDRDPFSFYPTIDGSRKKHTTFDSNKALLQRKMKEAQQRDQRANAEIDSFDFNSLPEPPMDR